MKSVATPPLFFSSNLQGSTTTLSLEGDEATHAIKARRLREGDSLHLTNGTGLLAEGRIDSLDSRQRRLEIAIGSVQSCPEPRISITLGSALPKGERLATLLDMATQLGVASFLPLECDYSVVHFQPKMRERWQRIIVSAAKQSRQTRFPDIAESTTLTALITSLPNNCLVLYGDPRGKSIYQVAAGIMQQPNRIILLAGPEGGFSEAEVKQLQPHVALSCGSLVLRTETAALAMLAAAQQLVHQFN